MTIGWEEHVSPSWIYSVGDRGYDDVKVDVRIGEPFLGNVPPEISEIADRTIDELTTLTINVPATDPDEGDGDVVTYSFDDGPSGMSISTDGVISWTPTEEQGPNTYNVTVRATDLVGAFDTKSFSVTVDEVNVAPILSPVQTQRVDELSLLEVRVTLTDSDIPVNTLIYSIDSGPSGASIDSATGVFSWTPTEAQGPGTYSVTVKVDDQVGGTDKALFDIEVLEVNLAPILQPISDQAVDELTEFMLTAVATDGDVPYRHADLFARCETGRSDD